MGWMAALIGCVTILFIFIGDTVFPETLAGFFFLVLTFGCLEAFDFAFIGDTVFQETLVGFFFLVLAFGCLEAFDFAFIGDTFPPDTIVGFFFLVLTFKLALIPSKRLELTPNTELCSFIANPFNSVKLTYYHDLFIPNRWSEINGLMRSFFISTVCTGECVNNDPC